jgi:hypothetical protein
VHIGQWGERQPCDDGGARAGDPADTVSAWQSLDAADQEILSLHVWEELSSAEAACLLGCSPTMYAVQLHRAKWRLAGHLKTYAWPGRLPSPCPDRSRRSPSSPISEPAVKNDLLSRLVALDAAPRRKPTPGQRARLREICDELGVDTAP